MSANPPVHVFNKSDAFKNIVQQKQVVDHGVSKVNSSITKTARAVKAAG